MDPQACLAELNSLLNRLESQIRHNHNLGVADVRSAVEHYTNLKNWDKSHDSFFSHGHPYVRLHYVLVAVRKEFNERGKHPGKFEGEAGHVIYLWESTLDGCGDVIISDDCGGDGVTQVGIDYVDAIIWPDLLPYVGKQFYLLETSQGFVSEISQEHVNVWLEELESAKECE